VPFHFWPFSGEGSPVETLLLKFSGRYASNISYISVGFFSCWTIQTHSITKTLFPASADNF